jgi:hypothetical protein
MPWTYNGEILIEPPEGSTGFIYIITNVTNNRQYIGQKVFTRKITRKPLKGKTQKRHSRGESDWQTYFGSSEELKADVVKLGEDKFTKEIIMLCESKALMNYFETKFQMDLNVLFYPEKYYNGIINIRTSRSQLTKFIKVLDFSKYITIIEKLNRR